MALNSRQILIRFRFRILILILLFSGNLKAQDEKLITFTCDNISFREFAARAESLLPLRFYFRDEWISDLRVTINEENILLTDLLDEIFRGTSLFYYIDERWNIYITRDFAVRVTETGAADDKLYLAPSDIAGETDNMQASGNLVVEIGDLSMKQAGGTVVVSGYITDAATREPLTGATIYVQDLSAGAFSDEFGHYSLTLPRGNHTVKISFLGMKERTVDLRLYGAGEMNIGLSGTLIPIKETVITASRDNSMIRRMGVGIEKVSMTTFRLFAAAMGESDIFSNFLMRPGVLSVGEGSAGFNVRGGSADQNLILLYDAPLYNPNHFFGFFSAVNSDIIRDVTLYKGGIPSRYGGRVSSVMNIESKEGSRSEFKGRAGISPVTTQLTIEGPLKKDTLFFMLAGRTTYSNWVFDYIDYPTLKRSKASFSDFNGKITYDIDRNNKIDLSSYFSHDSFRFNSDTLYSYNNNIVSLGWRHFFTSDFFSLISVNNSNYKYDISGDRVATDGFVLSHIVNSTGLKAGFNLYRGRHEMNFGLDATRYSISPGNLRPYSDSSHVAVRRVQQDKALESALYFDDRFRLSEKITLEGGIRLSSLFSFGPRTVLLYDPEVARGASSVVDTLTYSRGELYRTWGGPEYRFSVNFMTGVNSSIKLNYNRTRQYIHLLSNSASISPTDNWKLSDYYLKPQSGDQYAMGFYQLLFNGRLETSVEFYYKRLKNLIDFKGGTRIIMNENVEQDLVNTEGRAYGVELMVRKESGRLRWTAGYTYSRSLLRSTGKFSSEIINDGKWFPANFDRPHDLALTLNYLSTRRISISAAYSYSSGRPITYPITGYELEGLELIHYSDRNRYRIPDYMRVDLSLKVTGNLKSRKIAHPYWTFSVYNLLGRENVYSIYFTRTNGIVKGYKLSVFGNAIPSVTFSFDF